MYELRAVLQAKFQQQPASVWLSYARKDRLAAREMLLAPSDELSDGPRPRASYGATARAASVVTLGALLLYVAFGLTPDRGVAARGRGRAARAREHHRRGGRVGARQPPLGFRCSPRAILRRGAALSARARRRGAAAAVVAAAAADGAGPAAAARAAAAVAAVSWTTAAAAVAVATVAATEATCDADRRGGQPAGVPAPLARARPLRARAPRRRPPLLRVVLLPRGLAAAAAPAEGGRRRRRPRGRLLVERRRRRRRRRPRRAL